MNAHTPPSFHNLHFMVFLQQVAMLCCQAYCRSACTSWLSAGGVLYSSQGSQSGVEGKAKMADVAWLIVRVNADHVQETLVKLVGGLHCRVVEARQATSIKTTSQLVSLIGGSRKSKQGAGKQIHPATRVFQVSCFVCCCESVLLQCCCERTACLKLTMMVTANNRG